MPRADRRPPRRVGAERETCAAALAALDVLGAAGWAAVHERAATLAAQLADALAERGREVAPRDRTTLVVLAGRRPGGDARRGSPRPA